MTGFSPRLGVTGAIPWGYGGDEVSLLRDRAPSYGKLTWHALSPHQSHQQAVRAVVRHPCPVCGKKGYRSVTANPHDDPVWVCRSGHPHYVPVSCRASFGSPF